MASHTMNKTAEHPVSLRTERVARSLNGMLVIGHGTRSLKGARQLQDFANSVQEARPDTPVAYGLIEFARETGSPTLENAVDTLVKMGSGRIVAVPLVLLGAGHMKDDGPAILMQSRKSYTELHAIYARNLGIHPLVLDVAEQRALEAAADTSDAVVLVGRGSTDPDANSDLAKIARLLADGRGLGSKGHGKGIPAVAPPNSIVPPSIGIVEPAFVSLAAPAIPEALERCYALGARSISIVPYFIFTGLLLDRINTQATEWEASRPGTTVNVASELWPDSRLVELAWLRYDEALDGNAIMNCDCCIYRYPLPGYEDRYSEIK